MPNSKAAKKDLRQNEKHQNYNRQIMGKVKQLYKQSRQAIEENSPKAKELVAQTLKILDKAAQKGILKKNTCDRKKSRIHLKFNSISDKVKK